MINTRITTSQVKSKKRKLGGFFMRDSFAGRGDKLLSKLVKTRVLKKFGMIHRKSSHILYTLCEARASALCSLFRDVTQRSPKEKQQHPEKQPRSRLKVSTGAKSNEPRLHVTLRLHSHHSADAPHPNKTPLGFGSRVHI